MKVAIIGPNLYDQSKGSFHVHTASCRDGKNGRKYPLIYRHEVEVDSRHDVAEFIGEDFLSDYGIEPGSQEAFDYIESDWVPEFYFHGCVSDLPDIAPKFDEVDPLVAALREAEAAEAAAKAAYLAATHLTTTLNGAVAAAARAAKEAA
jgi:hypothetical protein